MKVRAIKRRRNAATLAEARFLFGDHLKSAIRQLRERCLVFRAINRAYDTKGHKRITSSPKGIHIQTGQFWPSTEVTK